MGNNDYAPKNHYITRDLIKKEAGKKGGLGLMMKLYSSFLRGKNRGNASSKLIKWKMGNPLDR